MTEAEIVSRVKIIMDEGGTESSPSLLSSHIFDTGDRIKSAIPTAITMLLANFPNKAVTKVVESHEVEMLSDGLGHGVVSTDNEILSIINIDSTSFDRPIFGSNSIYSESYKVDSNKFTRASICSPRCYWDEGVRDIELFAVGIKDGDELSVTYNTAYNGSITAEAGTAIANAICFLCAGLVYSSLGDQTLSARMTETALSTLK